MLPLFQKLATAVCGTTGPLLCAQVPGLSEFINDAAMDAVKGGLLPGLAARSPHLCSEPRSFQSFSW